VRVYNVLTGELDLETERPGYSWRGTRVGPRVGGEQIGASVYDLPDGERAYPYHFHHGIEEWLVVLDGTPAVRTPEGERTLRRGEVVCFPDGPEGAHAVRGPGRVLILSADRVPAVGVYPDSDKIGVLPPGKLFRAGDSVDYWEGE
jgi:uncharacterized cupin superfamily protein